MSNEHGPKRAYPVRCVTARQLAHGSRALLDEVEEFGYTFMITRRGQPIAFLTPPPEDLVAEAVSTIRREIESEPETLDVALEPIQEKMLVALSDGRPHADPISDANGTWDSALALPLAKLEFEKLIKREWTGAYTITKTGARVAKGLLNRTDDRPRHQES